MAASAGIAGFGTLFQVSISSTFTTVTEIQSITGPGVDIELIDVTHMESPSNYKEYVAGLIDGGEVSIEFSFVPFATAQQYLLDNLRVVQAFKILWPGQTSGQGWTFSGFVMNFQPSATHDGKAAGSCTIKVTGAVTSPNS